MWFLSRLAMMSYQLVMILCIFAIGFRILFSYGRNFSDETSPERSPREMTSAANSAPRIARMTAAEEIGSMNIAASPTIRNPSPTNEWLRYEMDGIAYGGRRSYVHRS